MNGLQFRADNPDGSDSGDTSNANTPQAGVENKN